MKKWRCAQQKSTLHSTRFCLTLPPRPTVCASLCLQSVCLTVFHHGSMGFQNNLEWALDNDVSDLGLTFSHCLEHNGTFQEVELKNGGCSIAVTDSTKHEYASLLIGETTGRPIGREPRRLGTQVLAQAQYSSHMTGLRVGVCHTHSTAVESLLLIGGRRQMDRLA